MEKLQGIWVESLSPEKQNPQNLYHTEYKFQFTCDSVFITINTQSRVNYEDEHCFNQGAWKEFLKGGYKVIGDSLEIEGVYCKPNFKMKTVGCYHSGNFHDVYRILPERSDYPPIRNVGGFQVKSKEGVKHDLGNFLRLQSPHEPEIINLNLIQRVPCGT